MTLRAPNVAFPNNSMVSSSELSAELLKIPFTLLSSIYLSNFFMNAANSVLLIVPGSSISETSNHYLATSSDFSSFPLVLRT